MERKEITMVEMTPEEKVRYEAYKAAEAKRILAEAKKKQRRELQEMTDNVMEEAVRILKKSSAQLQEAKHNVMNTFSALMELRKEVNNDNGRKEQDSYMFTNSAGTQRIIIGYNLNDNYLDQVDEGIAKVKTYLQSLARDERSAELIDMVLKLLSRDQKGNLKASRVIQLGQLAENSGDDDFMEGLRIIREAYRPIRSKLYIRCSTRDDEQEWKDLPLGIREV